MASFGANMPEGRPEVSYPDGMSLEAVHKRISITIAILKDAFPR